MTVLRIAALALAVMAAGFATAGSVKSALKTRTDAAVASIVNQAFDALTLVAAPAPDLVSALRPARSGRQPVARPDRQGQTVTIEQRVDTAASILVRMPMTKLAAAEPISRSLDGQAEGH